MVWAGVSAGVALVFRVWCLFLSLGCVLEFGCCL